MRLAHNANHWLRYSGSVPTQSAHTLNVNQITGFARKGPLWRFNENPAAPVLHGEHIPVSAGLIKGNDRPEVDLLMRRSLRRRKPLNCSNCGRRRSASL